MIRKRRVNCQWAIKVNLYLLKERDFFKEFSLYEGRKVF